MCILPQLKNTTTLEVSSCRKAGAEAGRSLLQGEQPALVSHICGGAAYDQGKGLAAGGGTLDVSANTHLSRTRPN